MAGEDVAGDGVDAEAAGVAVFGDDLVALGVAGEEVARGAFLSGDSERDEIVAEDRNARCLGVNAVPCFIFAGQYAISGAQEPEFFLPVFDLVLNGAQAAPGAIT